MKIFISYARVNRKQVETLEKLLTDLGHDAWFDREIVAGEDWWKSITSSIERCEVFVFALSPQSTNSSACRAEFQYALDLNKPILPVMLLEAELPIGKLRETQFVNGRALKSPETIIELSKALSAIKDRLLAGEYPTPEPLPASPAFPFPPDPLAEIRQKMQHVEALTEQDLLEIVYQLSATARVGAKTEREAVTILQEIARHPRSTLRVAQMAKEAIQLRSGRRNMAAFIGLTLVVVAVIVVAAILVLTNALQGVADRGRTTTETAQAAARTEAAGTQGALGSQVAVLQQQTATLDSRLYTLEAAQTAATPNVTATLAAVTTAAATASLAATVDYDRLADTGCTLTLTQGAVNIRQYPGNNYEIVTRWLDPNDVLRIFGYSRAANTSVYYLVNFDNQWAWISSGLDNTQLRGTCTQGINLPFISVVFPTATPE